MTPEEQNTLNDYNNKLSHDENIIKNNWLIKIQDLGLIINLSDRTDILNDILSEEQKKLDGINNIINDINNKKVIIEPHGDVEEKDDEITESQYNGSISDLNKEKILIENRISLLNELKLRTKIIWID